MKQEIVNFFLKNGRICGWNQLNGMINRFAIFLCFIFISSFCFSQEIYFHGLTKSIKATNTLVVENLDDHKLYIVKIRDTDSISYKNPNYESAISYLKSRVLNKEVFVFYEIDHSENIINGSILYECVLNEDMDTIDDNPCTMAYNLDVELIKKNYVIYKGSNKFLRKLNTGW
ncbi:hypothetical protein [Winogradskyella luteola]|uniref:Uncharacterized protein n=1 Tax=Winogradskyella luteola TaxID=2828330 RepID=A0A9X1FD64_9FLAO|nr:hypothetical protein [Winogradskyella luteola]MBV7270740.1 hypothetical protein [Winogradskyella luteola]